MSARTSPAPPAARYSGPDHRQALFLVQSSQYISGCGGDARCVGRPMDTGGGQHGVALLAERVGDPGQPGQQVGGIVSGDQRTRGAAQLGGVQGGLPGLAGGQPGGVALGVLGGQRLGQLPGPGRELLVGLLGQLREHLPAGPVGGRGQRHVPGQRGHPVGQRVEGRADQRRGGQAVRRGALPVEHPGQQGAGPGRAAVGVARLGDPPVQRGQQPRPDRVGVPLGGEHQRGGAQFPAELVGPGRVHQLPARRQRRAHPQAGRAQPHRGRLLHRQRAVRQEGARLLGEVPPNRQSRRSVGGRRPESGHRALSRCIHVSATAPTT